MTHDRLFLYTSNPDDQEPIMLINKHIGNDKEDGIGVLGNLFVEELMYLDSLGKKRIQIWINSVGGTVLDGMAIYYAILKTKTKVDTYCMGICASIAGVIFEAGRTRYMADFGLLMLHNPSGGTDDKELDAIKESLKTMIASRSGKTEDEVSALMDRTSWIGSKEALETGMCDKIESSADANRPRLKTEDITASWKQAAEYINKEVPKPNVQPTMKKVTNKLGLNESASEDSIASAIETIINSSAENKTKAEQMEQKLKDAKDAYDKMKAEYDKFKTDTEKATKDAKDAADAKAKAEAETEAENVVNKAVKDGRIKNDKKTIETWKNQLTNDLPGGKLMLESLPLNKASVKIETGSEGEHKPGSVIANTMADIRNKLEEKEKGK